MQSFTRSRALHRGFLSLVLGSTLALGACGGGGGGDSASSASPNGRTNDATTGAAPPASTPTPDPAAPPGAPGSATLSWMPPTENTDGTALDDLRGYRVYIGRAHDELSIVVTLESPGLTRYVVENLSSGTWYFAIASYAQDGTESMLSGVVSKTVA